MALELFETLHPLTEISASRWNEFRIFLDTVIYKIIKLYFYSGLPNLAYKKFLVHLRSIGTVLETRGFSKDGFAYKNWRALQHLMLAELAVKGLPPGNTAIAPDADERVPADCLPRTGLLHLSAVHLWFDLLGNDWSEDAGNPDPFMNKDSTNLEEINILLKKSLVAATKDFALPTQMKEVLDTPSTFWENHTYSTIKIMSPRKSITSKQPISTERKNGNLFLATFCKGYTKHR